MRSHMQKYVVYVQIYANFFDILHSFCICDFENAIICGKICNMQILAEYAIAYSHITNICSHLSHKMDQNTAYLCPGLLDY